MAAVPVKLAEVVVAQVVVLVLVMADHQAMEELVVVLAELEVVEAITEVEVRRTSFLLIFCKISCYFLALHLQL